MLNIVDAASGTHIAIQIADQTAETSGELSRQVGGDGLEVQDVISS